MANLHTGLVGVAALLAACGGGDGSYASDLPLLTSSALADIAQQNPRACAFVDLTEGQETAMTGATYLTQLAASGPNYDKYIGSITPGGDVIGFQCLRDKNETAKYLEAQARKAGFAARVYVKVSNGVLAPA